ncbi:MAG: phage protease [Pseudomonadota bacterium]
MKNAHVIIAAIDLKDGKAPEWIQLYAPGMVSIDGEGHILVDRQSFDQLAAYIAKRGIDIVFDYEHQTLKDIKAPAAGWIRELKWDDAAGITCRVDWTAEAAGYIERGEYRYFSPVTFRSNTDGRIVGVHSVALTNAPKTNHLRPILAKLGSDINKEEDTMNLLQKLIAKLKLAATATEDDVMAAVAKLTTPLEAVAAKLALATDATETQVIEAIERLRLVDKTGMPVVAKEVTEALGLTATEGISTVVASIHALRQGAKGMVSRDEFAAVVAKLADRDASDAVTAAMKAGKITPDQKPWATDYATRDLPGFTTFVAKAPVVITPGKLPDSTLEAPGAVSDATMTVAKFFGNTKEDLEKYGSLQ